MAELISIRQAAERGITRLRRAIWSNSLDHIEIEIVETPTGKEVGVWTKLYSPYNKALLGKDPFVYMVIPQDDPQFYPYEGPLSDSKEYTIAAQDFLETEVLDD